MIEQRHNITQVVLRAHTKNPSEFRSDNLEPWHIPQSVVMYIR